MIYLRGHIQGFDAIANKTNDPRWRMENVLKYYKRIENYHGWFQDGNFVMHCSTFCFIIFFKLDEIFSGQNHGSYGPMNIEKAFLSPMTQHMLRAGEELGYPIRDSNAYGPYTEGIFFNYCINSLEYEKLSFIRIFLYLGFAPMEFHMKFGRRADAYHTAVQPLLLYRPNLVIRKYALVTKILFKRKTAYGVQYERHGFKFKAFAKKEVILSAGSLWSPKLLMLSGIGPKHHLETIGVCVNTDHRQTANYLFEYSSLL